MDHAAICMRAIVPALLSGAFQSNPTWAAPVRLRRVTIDPVNPSSGVWVFFYGSYMNLDVLREVNFVPGAWKVARLAGFDISIRPRANLTRSDRDCVFGLLATATHAELERLYSHARDTLGAVYRPHPVLTETLDGKVRPALCYLADDMAPTPVAGDYLDRILGPAKAFGFPGWYIARLERFRASRDSG